jgi:predicted metal-dependent enzyme (double-stranded beta helix superfamily)
MNKFSIEGFAAGCKRAMAGAANRELAAKTFLEKVMQENDLTEIADFLDAAIPAGADVGEMIVHTSPELTILYARVPARFQSGIHNHTVFACMGQLEGSEVSTIYKQIEGEQRLTVAEVVTAHTGSVISLPADAIHHIENPDNTTARSLHVYGGDFAAVMDERSLWDSDDHQEKVFSFQELISQSIKTMKAHHNQVGLEAVAKAIPATRPLIEG